jgi:hypothetical protein
MKYLFLLVSTSSAEGAKEDSSLKAQCWPFLARERLMVWRSRAAAGRLVILALGELGPGDGDLEGEVVVIALPFPLGSFLLGIVPGPEVELDALALVLPLLLLTMLLLLLLASAVIEAAVVVMTITSSFPSTSSVVVGVGV